MIVDSIDGGKITLQILTIFFTKMWIFEKKISTFLVISQELFNLQRRTIPPFDRLRELI